MHVYAYPGSAGSRAYARSGSHERAKVGLDRCLSFVFVVVVDTVVVNVADDFVDFVDVVVAVVDVVVVVVVVDVVGIVVVRIVAVVADV